MEETWKDAYGYEDILKVSNKGRIYRKSRYVNNNGTQVKRKGRMASLYVGGSGYYYVNISVKGKRKNLRVHRVVLQTFQPIDNYEEMTVNHKDGEKLNNNLDNLEWMTLKENIRHAWDTGIVGSTGITMYKHKCKSCGKHFEREREESYYCSVECSSYGDRKVKKRPSKDYLYELIKENNFRIVGRKYGVTDNTIRKWCKDYGIPHKASYYRKYEGYKGYKKKI